MQIHEYKIDSLLVIRLTGDLDGRSAPVAQEQILPSLPADEKILLDLTGVPFVSSAGLRTMLLIYRQAQIMNSSVALVGLSARVHVPAGGPEDGAPSLSPGAGSAIAGICLIAAAAIVGYGLWIIIS